MRVINRLGGLVLGVALLALGLLAIVETIAVTVWNRSWPLPVQQWRRDLNATQWSDNRVLLASIIAFLAGFLILISQLGRVRPAHLSTTWNTDDDTWVLNRRSLERQAVAAAETIRGVDSARASTAGKEQHWRLAVTTKVAGNVVSTDQVEQVVQDQMRSLGVPAEVPVRVSVRRSKSPA